MSLIKSLIHRGINEFKSYIKVCLVGLVGMIIQLIVFNILRHFMPPQYANAIATELAIISNFLLNNRYSFRQHRISRSHHGYSVLLKKGIHFNLISLFSLLIQVIVVSVGVHLLGRGIFIENGLVVLGVVLGSLINYFTYSRFIWRKKKTPS